MRVNLNWLRILTVVVFVALLKLSSSANLLQAQHFFLPGDAFFPFDVPISSPDEQLTLTSGDKTGTLLDYSYLAGRRSLFLTPLGYRQIFIQSDTSLRTVERAAGYLKSMYRKGVFDDSRNVLTCFVSSKDFDIENFTIGLRYNEDWVSESERLSSIGKRYLGEPISSPFAIEESWRDAALVASLPHEIIEVPMNHQNGSDNSKMVVAVNNDVKFVVAPLSNSNLKSEDLAQDLEDDADQIQLLPNLTDLYRCQKFGEPIKGFVYHIAVATNNTVTIFRLNCRGRPKWTEVNSIKEKIKVSGAD